MTQTRLQWPRRVRFSIAFCRLMAMMVMMFLSACTTMRSREEATSYETVPSSTGAISSASACGALRAHEAMACRRNIESFKFEGRVAISNGEDAGSANVTWAQDGAFYDIELRIGLTGQIFRLSGDDHTAMLDGVTAQPLMDTDADRLLRRETGFSLPVRAMRDWVRGSGHGIAPSDEKGQEVEASAHFNAQGKLQELREAGWVIQYDGFETETGHAMPQRLRAEKDTHKIRLVISQWKL